MLPKTAFSERGKEKIITEQRREEIKKTHGGKQKNKLKYNVEEINVNKHDKEQKKRKRTERNQQTKNLVKKKK